MPELEQSLLLWLPDSSNFCDEELGYHSQNIAAINSVVLDFCEGEKSLTEAIEIIEFYGADIDDYLQNLEQFVLKQGG